MLEVGLGGRLDTTNTVASKAVAVITPIDFEHTAILGDTIAQIAGEKAGIITGPCAVVAAPMRESALDVVRQRAAAAGATLHSVPEACALRVVSQTLDEQRFDLRTPLRTYRGCGCRWSARTRPRTPPAPCWRRSSRWPRTAKSCRNRR